MRASVMPSPRAVRSAILAVLWVTNAAMAQEAYEGDQKEGRWGKVLDRIVDGGHCGVQHHQRGTGKVFKGHGHKRKWWAQTKRSPERVALLQIAPETTATTRVWDKRGGAREQKKTTPVESYQTY